MRFSHEPPSNFCGGRIRVGTRSNGGAGFHIFQARQQACPRSTRPFNPELQLAELQRAEFNARISGRATGRKFRPLHISLILPLDGLGVASVNAIVTPFVPTQDRRPSLPLRPWDCVSRMGGNPLPRYEALLGGIFQEIGHAATQHHVVVYQGAGFPGCRRILDGRSTRRCVALRFWFRSMHAAGFRMGMASEFRCREHANGLRYGPMI